MKTIEALDAAVQDLVDHDLEDQRRVQKRYRLMERIVELMQQRGHYLGDQQDPIVFRCGDVVVTAKAEQAIEWKIVRRLPNIREESENDQPACLS